jgi:hypothetical protein
VQLQSGEEHLTDVGSGDSRRKLKAGSVRLSELVGESEVVLNENHDLGRMRRRSFPVLLEVLMTNLVTSPQNAILPRPQEDPLCRTSELGAENAARVCTDIQQRRRGTMNSDQRYRRRLLDPDTIVPMVTTTGREPVVHTSSCLEVDLVQGVLEGGVVAVDKPPLVAKVKQNHNEDVDRPSDEVKKPTDEVVVGFEVSEVLHHPLVCTGGGGGRRHGQHEDSLAIHTRHNVGHDGITLVLAGEQSPQYLVVLALGEDVVSGVDGDTAQSDAPSWQVVVLLVLRHCRTEGGGQSLVPRCCSTDLLPGSVQVVASQDIS